MLCDILINGYEGDYKNVCFSFYIDIIWILIWIFWYVYLVFVFMVFYGIINFKMVFIFRFMRMVNCYIMWMVKMRIFLVGCVLFVVCDIKENRIFLFFSIIRKFIIECFMIFLLV